MRMDELQRGFWGYKKDSVYNYIVMMEEEASKRMAEKNARIDKLEMEVQRQRSELASQYDDEIDKLKAEITALQEENESLRNNQDLVFSTMLEAQKCADRVKTDSVRQAQQAQQELSMAVQQKNQQIDNYVKQIQQIRTMIRDLLEEFDGKTEELEKALIRLPDHAPSPDLNKQAPDIKILSENPPAAEPMSGKPSTEKTEKWNKISFT